MNTRKDPIIEFPIRNIQYVIYANKITLVPREHNGVSDQHLIMFRPRRRGFIYGFM